MSTEIPYIRFRPPAENWAVTTTGGDIQAKGKFAVSWDPARIENPNTVATGDGPAYAVVNANVRFLPVDSFATLPVARAYGGAPMKAQDAIFDVPAGTTGLEVWIDNPEINSGKVTAEKWDSNYGNDWRFPVAPPATGN